MLSNERHSMFKELKNSIKIVAQTSDRAKQQLWEDLEEAAALNNWNRFNDVLFNLGWMLTPEEYNEWTDVIQGMLPENLYIDPYVGYGPGEGPTPIIQIKDYPQVKTHPRYEEEENEFNEYLVGENVEGIWIHVIPVDLSRHGLYAVKEDIYTTLTAKGEISVSDYNDPSTWFQWRPNKIGIVFDGTVSQLYSKDVWSSPLPTGERKPNRLDTKTDVIEGFLDPRLVEPIALVVDKESENLDFVRNLAVDLGLDYWEL